MAARQQDSVLQDVLSGTGQDSPVSNGCLGVLVAPLADEGEE